LPSELLIPITDTADSAVALSLGFRPRSDRESDPAAWSLLAAALDRGDGSLSQRLSTACGAAVDAGVQFDQIGVRGGALLFEAVVPNSCAEQALGVLRGTIESLRALPLRDDQVARAWARRETAIAQERSARLLDSLIYEPQAAWPPSVRSRRELRGEELTELLRPHLDKQRMVLAVAGSWSPSGTAQALRRIDPERFAPAIPGLERPITAREESAQIARAGEALAQELLLLLSEGQRRRAASGHAARYRVVEDTPLGPVDAELRVRDARGDTTVWLERDRFLLAAGSPPSGSPSESASLRLEATGGQSSSHAIDDRVSVAALRQPAVLAEAVLDGRIGAQSALATCGEGTCPALLAERADGTSLLLLLDGRTRLPIGLHVWWPGSDHSAGPDEEVSYRAWSEVGEVRIASSLDIADARGGHRQLTLLAWDWMPTP
jgi:hypothetical protein